MRLPNDVQRRRAVPEGWVRISKPGSLTSAGFGRVAVEEDEVRRRQEQENEGGEGGKGQGGERSVINV